MKLKTDCMVPIEDVNKDFSKAEGIIDEAGLAVVIKDNKPKYVILDYNKFVLEQKSSNENIEDVAGRFAAKNHSEFEHFSLNQGNDEVAGNIKLNDILSLNDGYKADDVFGLYNNNLAGSNIKKDEEIEKNDNIGEEIKLNTKSYSEDRLYLDEATKKTIEELKELIRGKV